MKEITTPSKTSLNEPATQKATGGRSSFKRAHVDQPSQTKEPVRCNFSSMPSFVGKDDFMNQKPRSLAYIDQFPNMFHPYIKEVQDPINKEVKDPLPRNNNSSGQTGRSSHFSNPGMAKQPKVHTGSYANVVSGAQGIKSWFLDIKDAVDEFVSEDRIIWMDIEGVPLKAWSRETRLLLKDWQRMWGETLTWGLFMLRHLVRNNGAISIKRKDCNSDGESVIEPLNNNDNEEEFDDEYASDVNEVPETVPWVQYSIRTFASIGLSGNDSLGNSGGILCIWEATIFKKEKYMISDNFIAIYRSWLPNNAKILFIAVYAPQQASSKAILWDYISVLLTRWNGETIVMGDFNEVRSSEERHGSCFNPYSARRSFSMRSKRDTINELGEIDKDLDSGLISETIILRRLELKRNGSFPRGVTRRVIALIPRSSSFLCPTSILTCPPGSRQILDGPFILDELLQWCKRRHKQAMFFKVEFAKAYDSIHWDYLLDVLESFGFGPVWCNWIRGSLNSAKASILVNGSPTNEFSLHCGLKQGDPLAPYLFILVMESLHLSIRRLVDNGLFSGIQLPGSVTISHLFYADDAMFIEEWYERESEGSFLTLLNVPSLQFRVYV
ncbi:RNA-directed DNA polymerase, eukaryota [Tanacetum coccineum]